MRKITHIVIHHSLTKDGEELNWRAIRKYHIQTNGWSDVGYHYGIERVGKVVTLQYGRSVLSVGAHVAGFNSNSIGICIVGNYDKIKPPKDLLNKAQIVVKALQDAFKIPRKNVIGHREAQELIKYKSRKSCPGLKFDMDKFREGCND